MLSDVPVLRQVALLSAAARRRPAPTVLGLMLCLVAAYVVAPDVRAMALRIGYPYELEWMEGGMVDHVAWIRAGHHLYVEPSIDFVPYIYNPLYVYLAAALSPLLGVGFLGLRLISILATVGSCGVLAWMVRRMTGSGAAGAITAGLFLATYPLSGAWMDMGRNDPLALLLLLLAAAHARLGTTTRGTVLAAAFLWLSFLTKQYGLAMAPALALTIATRRSLIQGVVFGSCLVGLTGASVGVLQLTSGGWYWYYAFAVPAHHGWYDGMSTWQVLGEHYWGEVPVMLAGSCALVVGAVPWWKGRAWPGRDAVGGWLFLTLFLPSTLYSTLLARVHQGGADNVLMFGHAALALGTGTVVGWSLRRYERAPRVAAGVVVAVALQLVYLSHVATPFIPTAASRRQGDAFVRYLRGLDGEVLVTAHGHYGALAGKGRQAHAMAAFDILQVHGEGMEAPKQALRRSAREAFARHRFAHVVLDSRRYTLMGQLAPYYRVGPLPAGASSDRLKPVSGWRIRPTYLATPRRRP